jgi:hypothetical protein
MGSEELQAKLKQESEELDKVLKQLEQVPDKRLEKLKRYDRNLLAERVKSVLQQRDKVEILLDQFRRQQNNKDNNAKLTEPSGKIDALDKRIEREKLIIAKVLESVEEIRLFQPRDAGEWWSFSTPPSCWDRFDWLFNVGTFTCIAVSLGFASALFPPLWAGGSSTYGAFWGSLSVIAPTLLGLLPLEKASQVKDSLEQTLEQVKLPRNYKEEIIFAMSAILCVVLGLAFFQKNIIANTFYKVGTEKMANGSKGMASAESNLKVAIALNPNHSKAHFKLGWLYELRRDLDKSREQYKLSMKSHLIEDKSSEDQRINEGFFSEEDAHLHARIRLASLILKENFLRELELQGQSAKVGQGKTINQQEKSDQAKDFSLEKSPSTAAAILLQGLGEIQSASKDTQKSWYTVLGWARLQQERYQEAKEALDIAVSKLDEILEKSNKDPDVGRSAYCVKAELLDIQSKKKTQCQPNIKDERNEACKMWYKCRSFAGSVDPDEDIWLGKARDRLGK